MPAETLHKILVFEILKRESKVYTQIIKSCTAIDILSIINEKADKEATTYTDRFRTYDSLADFEYKRHFRIKHSENEFAKDRNHINRIELQSNRET